MGDRCSGDCCREFTLTGFGATPEAIVDTIRAKSQDGAVIADMVVPLRAIVPGTVLPDGTTCETEPPGGGWVFTCRHFDDASGNCGIYASRPRMCRNFPYGRACEHPSCTWDAGRAGAWPLHFTREVPLPDEPGMVLRFTHLRVLGAGGQAQEAALREAADRTARAESTGAAA